MSPEVRVWDLGQVIKLAHGERVAAAVLYRDYVLVFTDMGHCYRVALHEYAR